jgi:hypothetical protein
VYEQFKTTLITLKDKLIHKQRHATSRSQWANEAAQLRTELLRQGSRAEDLQEFMSDFMKTEELRTLTCLSRNEYDADSVKRDYQASIRLYTYLSGIITEANIQKSKKGD